MEKWFEKIKATPKNIFYSRDPERDPRLGDVVFRFDDVGARSPRPGGGTPPLHHFDYALIGFPEDRGVRKNKGRVGAAKGPTEIRKAFYKMVAFNNVGARSPRPGGETPPLQRIVDLGDIRPRMSLEQRQKDLGVVVRACFEAGVFPIILGGGHETTYGHFLGYLGKIEKLGVLNIDAHLDVRPLDKGGHSGTPFRQILETAGSPVTGPGLIEFGLQGQCNARQDLDFAKEKKINLYWLEEIKKWGVPQAFAEALRKTKTKPFYLTICLDSLSGAEFPGTSAAPADGFSFQQMLEMVELAAPKKNLIGLDLAEYAPAYDPTGVGAKRVALLIYRFLNGRTHD